MYETSLGSVTAEVEDLLSAKFSAKGRNLEGKLKSVGNRLPRSIRADAAYLAEVQARCQNPKRAHEYDPARVLKAQKHCIDKLATIDTGRIAARRRLGWFTGVLVNLFLLAIGFAVIVSYVNHG